MYFIVVILFVMIFLLVAFAPESQLPDDEDGGGGGPAVFHLLMISFLANSWARSAMIAHAFSRATIPSSGSLHGSTVFLSVVEEEHCLLRLCTKGVQD